MTLEFIGCSAPYRESIEARLGDRLVSVQEDYKVVLIECDSEERWAALDDACAKPDLRAIAVIVSLAVDHYARALAAGAAGVVYIDTASAITADVIVAATQGDVLLPRQAALNMAERTLSRTPRTDLDDAEKALLVAVAGGRTIVSLAEEWHYSERTVRRHFQSLCLKLGVQNRAEAIAAASRMGLID